VAAVLEAADEPVWDVPVRVGLPVVPDEAAVAVLDDLSDAAEPAVFADEDPAEDEDPAVSAHAIPAPPNNAAPTPRAMARPPTRPM
jgi:hypothetical protein